MGNNQAHINETKSTENEDLIPEYNDLVHALSIPQRQQRLVDGYIRSLNLKITIATDVKTICMQYIKTISIKSQTEIDEENSRQHPVMSSNCFFLSN